MNIKKVGIVGCGIMGSGITQVVAHSGYSVTVFDINEAALKTGLESIRFRLQKSVDKGKLSIEKRESILAGIRGTTDISDFGNCDFVIEAVFDNLEIKRKVFSELDNICPKHAILASNASSLSIIDIAAATKRMDKVLGMHFFNPVPVMKLVEVVKTIATSEETVEISKEFGEKLGKTVVIAPDMPGYIHNRLTAVLSIAAIKMLEDKIAGRDDIDTALKLGSNLPMGRLELLDMVGLDTLLEGYENLYQTYKDPKYAPPLLLKQMVAAGWLGRKSGRGFYIYDKNGNKIG
ncbi:MAG: 3-hydroxyacyl-CoA dehydrogenase family protein [Dehalococcoidales bacterium]|nr:3-hydroxyacyl-CoA dehydrogenase family protein [Dehalococcoidales bacterium]